MGPTEQGGCAQTITLCVNGSGSAYVATVPSCQARGSGILGATWALFNRRPVHGPEWTAQGAGMTQAYATRVVFARFLTVLAVLGGLFAMHVLASGTHSAHAGAATSVTSPAVMSAAVMSAPAMSAPGMASHPAADHVRASSIPMAAAAVPGQHGAAGAAMGALCVVVLLAVGLSLAVPRQHGVVVARPPVLTPTRQRSAAPCRGPPRDLLAQLCVLRT